MENTTTGLSRDVGFLKLVSDVSGVHIISGTGDTNSGFQVSVGKKYILINNKEETNIS